MNFGEESCWVLHERLQETAWLKTRLICLDQKTFCSWLPLQFKLKCDKYFESPWKLWSIPFSRKRWRQCFTCGCMNIERSTQITSLLPRMMNVHHTLRFRFHFRQVNMPILLPPSLSPPPPSMSVYKQMHACKVWSRFPRIAACQRWENREINCVISPFHYPTIKMNLFRPVLALRVKRTGCTLWGFRL